MWGEPRLKPPRSRRRSGAVSLALPVAHSPKSGQARPGRRDRPTLAINAHPSGRSIARSMRVSRVLGAVEVPVVHHPPTPV